MDLDCITDPRRLFQVDEQPACQLDLELVPLKEDILHFGMYRQLARARRLEQQRHPLPINMIMLTGQVNAPKTSFHFRLSNLQLANSLNHIPNIQLPRRPRRAWMRPNLRRRALADDAPVVQQQDAVCNRKGFLLVVRNVHRRDACLVQDVA